MTLDELQALVRTVPDFPEPGIQFRDITTLIGHGAGLAASIDHLAQRVEATGARKVAGLEARGFIFGAGVAAKLGLGFVAIRKPGKLPVETIGIDYALEYGTDRLEIDPGSVGDGEPVALVDDLIATGGTAVAGTQLLRNAGASVSNAFFVIDLPALGGATKLSQHKVGVDALMAFDGA